MLLDHVSVQCSDPLASATFYDSLFGALDVGRAMEFGPAVGYGLAGKPEFWIGPLVSGEPNREIHLAFVAKDRARVRASFEAVTALGAEVLHAPRLWPEYHEHYYGAFVRDPDGNNVEVVCHTPEP
jgi:catechol 2,3-dioxygenase-like lactoylglutathione lyase family enzyme